MIRSILGLCLLFATQIHAVTPPADIGAMARGPRPMLTIEATARDMAMDPENLPMFLFAKGLNESNIDILEKARTKLGVDVNAPIFELHPFAFALQANSTNQTLGWLLNNGVPLNEIMPGVGFTPLTFAVANNRVGAAEFLLSQPGIGVNVPDSSGRTALGAAVIFCRPLAKLILERGGDVLHIDGKNKTPWELAIRSEVPVNKGEGAGSFEFRVIKLNYTMKQWFANTPTSAGLSSLLKALECESIYELDKKVHQPRVEKAIESMETLLAFMKILLNEEGGSEDGDDVENLIKFHCPTASKGDSPTASPEDAFCPLDFYKSQETVIVTIPHDMDIITAMIEARRECVDTSFKYVLAMAVGNKPSERHLLEDDFAAMSVAAAMGNEGLIRLLHEKGASLNTPSPTFQLTPLMVALSTRNQGTFKALLDLGADVNVADNRGWTPAMHAVAAGLPDALTLLYEKDASTLGPVSIIVNGEAASIPLLRMAMEWGKEDVARRLIELGVDLNDRNKANLSPLFVAVGNGMPSVVQALIDRDVLVVNTRCPSGFNPLIHAAFMPDLENGVRVAMYELLKKAGATNEGISVEFVNELIKWEKEHIHITETPAA